MFFVYNRTSDSQAGRRGFDPCSFSETQQERLSFCTCDQKYLDANGKLVFVLSPAAVEISKRLPQINDPCGRVSTGNPLHENRFQLPARVDYQLSPKQTFFARYMVTRVETRVPNEIRPNDVLTSTGFGADDSRNTATTSSFHAVRSLTVRLKALQKNGRKRKRGNT